MEDVSTGRAARTSMSKGSEHRLLLGSFFPSLFEACFQRRLCVKEELGACLPAKRGPAPAEV